MLFELTKLDLLSHRRPTLSLGGGGGGGGGDDYSTCVYEILDELKAFRNLLHTTVVMEG